MTESDYYLAFSNSPGIGPKRFKLLLKKFGSAALAFKASRQEYEKAEIKEKIYQKFDKFRNQFNINKYNQRLTEENVQFISQFDEKYPQNLKDLKDAPIGLFSKGQTSCLNNEKLIAVVGTRKTTSYGRQVTQSLVSSLVSHDFIIISGLALGIDAIAHKASVDNNGLTIAVLGCGVDCCYPRENQGIYNSILSTGGLIISEYPLGTTPTKGSFPARNRIIAGLSSAILIPEAGADSGSLITADYGLKFNKKIFAVPGPITSRQSDGTSYLLKNGAVLVQSVDDIVNGLGFMDKGLRKGKKVDIESLKISKEEKEILKLIQDEGQQMDVISKKLQIPIHKLSILISSLEIQGFISKDMGGEYKVI